MKKLLLPFAIFLTSLPALADSECHTPHKEVTAVLVFDNGPGGLDFAQMNVFGRHYSDSFFEVEGDPSLTKITDRDTFRGTYEYTKGLLQIGFTGTDGLQVDLFANEVRENRQVGTIHLVEPGKARRILPIICNGSL